VAIKGKGKTKSRPPTRAPRRAPVEVPTPFLQRRWVQLVAALLVGAGIVWFLIWLTNGIRQGNVDEREAAAQVERRRAVQGWKELVETELVKVGSLGAAGAPPAIAPELAATIEGLEQGNDDVAAIEDLDERLTAVADALEAFELAPAIRGKGFDEGQANALLDSRSGLASALRTQAAAARLALAAAELPASDRGSVLEEAGQLSEVANAALADAWNDYLLGLAAAGLTPDQAAPPDAGLGGIDTSGIPIGG
jgi:hypothetical protein